MAHSALTLPDILVLIFAYLPWISLRDLATASRVCKIWHEVGESYLHRHVVIHDCDDLENALQMLEGLRGRETPVRYLSIFGGPPGNNDAGTGQTLSIDTRGLSALFALCPHLRILRLHDFAWCPSQNGDVVGNHPRNPGRQVERLICLDLLPNSQCIAEPNAIKDLLGFFAAPRTLALNLPQDCADAVRVSTENKYDRQYITMVSQEPLNLCSLTHWNTETLVISSLMLPRTGKLCEFLPKCTTLRVQHIHVADYARVADYLEVTPSTTTLQLSFPSGRLWAQSREFRTIRLTIACLAENNDRL